MEAIRNIKLITWSRYAKLLNYDDGPASLSWKRKKSNSETERVCVTSKARSVKSLPLAGRAEHAPGSSRSHHVRLRSLHIRDAQCQDKISSWLSRQSRARTSSAMLDSSPDPLSVRCAVPTWPEAGACKVGNPFSILEREFAEEISRWRRRAKAQPDVTERRPIRGKGGESLPTVRRRAIPENLLQVRPPFEFSGGKVTGSDAARFGGQFDPFLVHRTFLW